MNSKTKKFKSKIIFAAAIILAAVCLTPVILFAAGIDTSKTGSITVRLLSSETGSAVKDGELTVYYAASVSAQGQYTYTDGFSGCGVDLSGGLTQSTAAKLAAYVKSSGVSGQTKTISSSGYAAFDGLPLGLYLVVQTGGSTGYYDVDSFIVTLPLSTDEGWVYDVDASPKVEVYAGADDDEDDEKDKDDDDDNDDDDDDDDPPSGGGGGGTKFGGSEHDDVTPHRQTASDPVIKDDKEDIPDRTIEEDVETPVDDPYEEREPGDIHEEITPPDEDISDPHVPDDKTAQDIVEEDKEEKLPKTGQLNWPVPVLAVCGLMLFAAGWKLAFLDESILD